ncbi:MAG: aminopeptidase [Acidobacteria bacterium]|nr:aminopeptidase [Acidobacteriota bacterium]
MPVAPDHLLPVYGELAVKVALNLRPGQRLFIIGPLANGGCSLEAAPLVRAIAESAYKAGASFVEALWGDEPLQLARFSYAPRDSFDQTSSWFADALVRHVHEGHAVLSIYANDPDLLKDQRPELVGAVQKAVSRAVRPFREHISKNGTNWSVIAAPSRAWAARVFPNLHADEQVPALWQAIAALVRLDRPDPIAAWEQHLEALAARRDLLNARRYQALKYRGPGTDLTIGLPDGHIWRSGRSTSLNGIVFAPNLPTEEVFTMPHCDRVDGTVTASKPLAYGGTLIDGFSMTFERGRVVRASAASGEAVLRDLLATDPGASRLGEVALVPHDSPVAQSGLLFYNTLFDENAASHVALGAAYKFTMEGGEAMSDDQFEAVGGNRSVTHVDFMIGSPQLDVDGVLRDGSVEPLMRKGTWTADIGERR